MDINKAYQLILQKLSLWMKEFIRLLPNILLAALMVVAGFLIAGLLKKVAAKLLGRILHNIALNRLLASLVYIFCIGIFIFSALSILQLDKAVTSLLAGAGILGLALAFAFQDIAANFISGIFISFRRPIYIGDIVKLKDYMGKIEQINLRDTVLTTFQGQKVIVPNKEVFQNPIENFSLLGKRRIDLNIGVSYGEDLEKVKTVTLTALKGMDGLAENDEITLFYEEFGGSTINFLLRMWIDTPEQPVFLKVRSEAIMRLKKAYDDNDIMLPFPTQTLDFGVKGGKPLDQMILQISNGINKS